ncbi:hypothetical protein [Argonema galeatum]|uniref:hypothetical protein n=1 Tax=Argonema galeatum TaxID=2942762 RepID=UPI0020112C8B|nr:hypothetical protein [Argonema galeatum]MCL1463117.1 hypothetical protein [Argonema galeatum A003/A1]
MSNLVPTLRRRDFPIMLFSDDIGYLWLCHFRDRSVRGRGAEGQRGRGAEGQRGKRIIDYLLAGRE